MNFITLFPRLWFISALLIFSLLCISLRSAAQISFIGAATNTGASCSNITINKPAGTATNDIMIAHIAVSGSSPVSISFLGWTQIRALDNTPSLYSVTLYKVATAADLLLTNYTFTYVGNCNSMSGGIITYRGVDQVTPVDVENGVNTASSNNHSTPAVITSTCNTMLVAFYGIDFPANLCNSSWTAAAGMSKRYDVNGTNEDIMAADGIQAAAGPVLAKTATLTTGCSGKGTAQIVALRNASPPPMTYVSSTTTQSNTSQVMTGSTNNEVIGIQIVTAGCASPLSVTSFTLNTTGTSNAVTDIQNAKIWYTGNSSTFVASVQFGTTFAAPNGSFSIAGIQSLTTGTNYFWLTYDVPSGATPGNFIDGECTSLIVTTPRTPSVTALAGNRVIAAPAAGSFQCSATNSTTGSSITISKPACTAFNDLMVAHLALDASGAVTVTPPAGWTQIRALNNTNYIYSVTFYKAADVSEPASYTFFGSGGTVWSLSGAILTYRGIDTGNPIDAENGQNTPSGTSHSTPSIITTVPNTIVAAFFAVDYNGSGPWTPPAGMTERYDINGTYEDIEGADAPQPAAGATGIKTATCASPDKGTAQIIALRPASPMVYVSSTTTQNNTSPVAIGTSNNEVIGIQILTSGNLSPLTCTSFTFNTNGTTNPALDIQNARVWYTGTSSSFAATSQFGTTALAPNGSFTVAGVQTLSAGANYFWLTYDVQGGATAGNFIDAECTSLTVTSPRTPTITAPAGNRQITNIIPPTYQCVSLNNCGCLSLTISRPGCTILNDIMIAHLTYRPNTGDVGITPPAGWTRIYYGTNGDAQTSMDVFYKIVTSSEPASYTFTQTSNGSDMSGAIRVYRGVDTANPLEDAGGNITPAGNSHTTPCITATTDQAMIVTFFSQSNCNSCDLNDNAWTPPPGMTERYDIGKVQSSWQGGSGDDVINPFKGCVQKTATSPLVASWGAIAAIAALRPVSATDYYSTFYKGNNILFSSGASLTLTRPAAIRQNDLMLVHLAQGYATGPAATPPAGWTLIRFDKDASNYIGSWLYYKVAGASEPPTYTFSVSSGINLMGSIMGYAGINPASPIQTSAGQESSATAPNHSTPSITTTSDSSVIVTFYCAWGSNPWTPPANTNERYDYANAQNHWKTFSSDDFILLSAGPTGIQTASSSGSSTGVAQIIALNRLTGKVKTNECCGFAPQGTAPLPVTLLSFDGKCVNNNIALRWITSSEFNNDFFTVECSTENENWEISGTVKGAGTSSQTQAYSFADQLTDNSYSVSGYRIYRLKQTDFNGTSEYLGRISIKCNDASVAEVIIHPNPGFGNYLIVSPSLIDTKAIIKVYNSLGQYILQSPMVNGIATIDIHQFSDGIYTVKLLSEGGYVITIKLIKQ